MIELHEVYKSYGQGQNQGGALPHLDLRLARGQFSSSMRASGLKMAIRQGATTRERLMTVRSRRSGAWRRASELRREMEVVMRTIPTVCLLIVGLGACEPYDPPEQDWTQPASCCGGAGTCVPSEYVPASLASQLDAAECGGALVCAPNDALFIPDAPPASCRAPGDLEGRCLSTCLPAVAAQAERLDQRGCDRDQRCVPCFDPLTGSDTEACRVAGDAPSEKARTYQRCCGAQGSELGSCVPIELLSSAQIDALPIESCRQPGTRCVPSALFDGSEGLGSCAAESLSGESSQGACMPECFLPLAARSLSAADGCESGERCVACANLDASIPACE